MFRHHFANAHATRSSFPQLMTGRYYHQNILRPFTPDEHPREFPFSTPDPTAVLLPGLLHDQGWQTLGVSAHPWVVSESQLGRAFERVDFVDAEPSRGHADAPEVVDRAIETWRQRDRSRSTFLYVHLMDMHMPRHLPEGEPRFPVAGFDWRQRFTPGGEPRFNPRARRWSQFDARDFTELDRRHFAAVYDTRLSYTDEHLGRLLAALRADDPGLRHTIVVVVADHGEELGEDGRTGHSGSLVDGVQHVPLIIAGGRVRPGQVTERFTEQIDILPTLLRLVDLPLPDGTRVDGRAQLGADGVLRPDHGKNAVYFTWEEYRAIRTRRHLLRQHAPGTLRARCLGPETLYRVGGPRPVALTVDEHPALAARLRARVARRLDRRERAFTNRRYQTPATGFLVRPEFWRVEASEPVSCVPLGAEVERTRLPGSGWVWTGRGLTVLHGDGERALPVAVPAPDGEYRVAVTGVPIESPPWLFGYGRWLRRSFLRSAPTTQVPLGTFRAAQGTLTVTIPTTAGVGRHIVGLRLLPADAPEPAPGAADDEDAELHQRLKALGYVE
jgi:arylsulfatase A-like enzyme